MTLAENIYAFLKHNRDLIQQYRHLFPLEELKVKESSLEEYLKWKEAGYEARREQKKMYKAILAEVLQHQREEADRGAELVV
jgi:hypothetical protein